MHEIDIANLQVDPNPMPDQPFKLLTRQEKRNLLKMGGELLIVSSLTACGSGKEQVREIVNNYILPLCCIGSIHIGFFLVGSLILPPGKTQHTGGFSGAGKKMLGRRDTGERDN